MSYITCNYQGRLGNLMYEIAATLAAAWDNNLTPCFPKHIPQYYEEQKSFTEYISRIVSQFHQYDKMRFANYYEHSEFLYQPIVATQDTKLFGYWTTSLYFDKYREKIIDLFLIDTELVNNLYEFIRSHNQLRQLVSVHVRRTDYVTDYNDALPVEYYQMAASYFPEAKFFIFSDDIPWCRDNLKFLKHREFISHKDYIEIQLMGKFDAHIVANSTFSAWGAMLGDRHKTKKVIAPRIWVDKTYNKDIQEKHWTVI